MTHTGYIMTLANSIIGVGILAMPFCFQKCGIILSIALLILSNLIARISCHYLLKSSLLTRKRSFEFLALYAFGPSGKFMVELCIIGYLVGTCITYFVVIGDLGPQIIAKIFNTMATESLRTWIMVIFTFICIIPLGLLKNVDSLSAVCTASIGFYFCLVVKVMFEARANIFSGEWMSHVDYWKPSGILQCLPIFSMALACQMQLFEVIESVNGATLEKLNEIVRVSTGICTSVYIFVGFFGYVAFCTQNFSGNILMNFSPSFASDAIKMGFVLSVAFSFPLAIFPCRASIYSLLYRRGHSDSTGYIPETRFKWITVAIVVCALVIGILIPSIELVIGLVGSTIGVAICVMFPASCFIKVFKKDSTEKLLAQLILICGFCLMILGTYANLDAIDEKRSTITIMEEAHISPLPEVLKPIPILPDDHFKELVKTNAPIVLPREEKIDRNEDKPRQKVDPMPKAPKEDVIISPKLDNKFVKEDTIDKPNPQDKSERKEKEKKIDEEVRSVELNQEAVKDDHIPRKAKGKESNDGINKDAIKKDEEVAAEEEKKKENIEEIKQAKKELKQTKELLEKKVIELQKELLKQNLETQQLVEEKLGVIVDKVDEIERKVNLEDKPVEKKIETNRAKENEVNEKIELPSKNPKLEKDSTPNDTIPKVYPNTNNDNEVHTMKKNKKLPARGPILTMLADKLPKLPRDTNTIVKHEHVNKTVYEPMSYKVGEALNLENRVEHKDSNKKSPPVPLPLFINSTLVKMAADANVPNDRDKKEIKESNTEKLSVVDNPDKPKQLDEKAKENTKDTERENIESIRRDILEVASNKEDTTQNLNNLREKRNTDDKQFCVNWDIEKEYCRDTNVNSELFSQSNSAIMGSTDLKTQPFGRDLKSVKEDE